MNFAAITICVASQPVFIVVLICFVIDSVRKILDTSSYEFHNRTHFSSQLNLFLSSF
jgi:hypothetical protein